MLLPKKIFDILFSLILLIFSVGLIILLVFVATVDTCQIGIIAHKRIGKNGNPFYVYKIRTMIGNPASSVTTSQTHTITKIGKFLRKYKFDELPQLINVLLLQMSFVGPRPDVKEYTDKLSNEERIILSVRPGITGPAQIKYRNEEYILSNQKDPVKYYDEVIWPDKVKINKEYVLNQSFWTDINYLFKTFKYP